MKKKCYIHHSHALFYTFRLTKFYVIRSHTFMFMCKMHVHFKAKQLNTFGIINKIVNAIMNLNHSQLNFISQKMTLMISK